MRVPFEYGDNFPVPRGSSWDPAVPWRFPRQGRAVRLQAPSLLARVMPWLTLGLGLTLGVLWMRFWA